MVESGRRFRGMIMMHRTVEGQAVARKAAKAALVIFAPLLLLVCGDGQRSEQNSIKKTESSIPGRDTCSAQTASDTTGWMIIRTLDDRVEFKLPRQAQRLENGAAEVWSLPGKGSFGYKINSSENERRGEVGWCTQEITGVPALMRNSFGNGVSGNGAYTQVVLPLENTEHIHLIGFVRDSSDRPIIAAIVASTRIMR